VAFYINAEGSNEHQVVADVQSVDLDESTHNSAFPERGVLSAALPPLCAGLTVPAIGASSRLRT
jgi:hypothetical protein